MADFSDQIVSLRKARALRYGVARNLNQLIRTGIPVVPGFVISREIMAAGLKAREEVENWSFPDPLRSLLHEFAEGLPGLMHVWCPHNDLYAVHTQDLCSSIVDCWDTCPEPCAVVVQLLEDTVWSGMCSVADGTFICEAAPGLYAKAPKKHRFVLDPEDLHVRDKQCPTIPYTYNSNMKRTAVEDVSFDQLHSVGLLAQRVYDCMGACVFRWEISDDGVQVRSVKSQKQPTQEKDFTGALHELFQTHATKNPVLSNYLKELEQKVVDLYMASDHE